MNCTVDLSDRLPTPQNVFGESMESKAGKDAREKGRKKGRSPHQEKQRLEKTKEVEQAFADRGWVLRSEYQGANKKIAFTCDKGHDHEIVWDSFRRGASCGKCYFVTHEQVDQAFKDRGWALHSQYKNAHQKLKFTCDKGHDHSMSWTTFDGGVGCRKCRDIGLALSQDEVEKGFADRGWILHSKYKHNRHKLEFTCDKGHRHSITWNSFKAGKGCGKCPRITHEMVEEAFRAKGWTLHSRYENAHQKLEFTCDKGHNHAIHWNNFSSGKGCGLCPKVTQERVEDAFQSKGWKLLSKYKNSTQKLKFVCDKGHHHVIMWKHMSPDAGCGLCLSGGYKPDSSGILYYVRFDLPKFSLWKIGITNRSVEKRFESELTPYTVLWERHYEDGKIPRMIERQILRKHKQFKYKGKALLSGNTECFTRDVLGYDTTVLQLDLFVA